MQFQNGHVDYNLESRWTPHPLVMSLRHKDNDTWCYNWAHLKLIKEKAGEMEGEATHDGPVSPLQVGLVVDVDDGWQQVLGGRQHETG